MEESKSHEKLAQQQPMYSWITAPSLKTTAEIRILNRVFHGLEVGLWLFAVKWGDPKDRSVFFFISFLKSSAFAYRSKYWRLESKDLVTAVTFLASWLVLTKLMAKRSALSRLAKGLLLAQVLSWSLVNIDGYLGNFVRVLYVSSISLAVQMTEWLLQKLRLNYKMRRFPSSKHELSTSWITTSLQTHGLLPISNRVTRVEVTSISNPEGSGDASVQQGFIGETVRLKLEYNEGDRNLPKTLVAKFASSSLRIRLKMRLVNVYLREAKFYASIAPLLEEWNDKTKDCSCIAVPRAYRVEYDDKISISTILMEDAAPLKPGDEILGATWDQACSVAVRYARFHSIFWSRSKQKLYEHYPVVALYRPYDWMDNIVLPMLLSRSVAEMMEDEDIHALISPSMQRLIGCIITHSREFVKYLQTGNMTFIHADARMENMLWPEIGIEQTDPKFQHAEILHAQPGVAFSDLYEREKIHWLSVDWQTSCTGIGIYDLAYFVALDLNFVNKNIVDDSCDRVLVKAYHDELMKYSQVAREDGYSFAACFHEYRLSMILALFIPIAVMRAESIGEGGIIRAKAVRISMFRRCLRAIERVKAHEAFYEFIDTNYVHRSLKSSLDQVSKCQDNRNIGPTDEILLYNLSKNQYRNKNGYDRWFLNGYSPDGKVFFAFALGMYPTRKVVDASFSVVVDGVQHNLRSSRSFDEKQDIADGKIATGLRVCVGAMCLTVLDPLKSVEISISLDKLFQVKLRFHARFPPHLEPKYKYFLPGIGKMEYDRMTQLVEWTGFIRLKGYNLNVQGYYGTRDRSWGIRPHNDKGRASSKVLNTSVGVCILSACLPARLTPQFYWFWTPINMRKFGVLYVSQQGKSGNSVIVGSTILGSVEKENAVKPLEPSRSYAKDENKDIANEVVACGHSLIYIPKTRHAKRGVIRLVLGDGRRIRLEFEPLYPFFMSGIGYNHPQWGHGMKHKGLDFCMQYDTIETFMANRNDSLHWHIQEISKFRAYIEGSDELLDTGIGTVEQLVVGSHAPSKFRGLYDT